MCKDCDKDHFGDYLLNAATLGIYAVVMIWRDIQEKKAELRAQEHQPDTAQPAQSPQDGKSQ